MKVSLTTSSVIIEKQDEESLDKTLNWMVHTPQNFAVANEDIKLYIANPSHNWLAIGRLLLNIRDQHLYRQAGYRSFSDYCKRSLNYSRQHAYKLINVAKFTFKYLGNANTEETRKRAQRLLGFGFTKLFVLHTLPESDLEAMLTEGIIVTDRNGLECRMPLEAARVMQLRFARISTGHEPDFPLNLTDQSESGEKSTPPLLTALKSQASQLRQELTQYCCQGISSPASLIELEQLASTLEQGLNILAASNTTSNKFM